MTITLAIAWLAALLTSAVVDGLAAPGVAPWHRRGVKAVVLHISTVTWLFILFLTPWGPRLVCHGVHDRTFRAFSCGEQCQSQGFA